jgi:hypothetical protein
MRDKSSTHQKVTKNGSEGWINKEVWAEMVKRNDTNGFHAVSSAPPEVEVLKQMKKTVEVPDEKEQDEFVDPNLTGETKEKGKPGPKPKNENQK